MAALEVLALDEATPKVRAPGASDTYTMPRATAIAPGTLTTDVKVLDLSATWNNAAVTFTGFKFNITNTASATGSKGIDFQLDGTSLFNIKPTSGGALAGAPSLQIGEGSTTKQGWILGTQSSGNSAIWPTSVTPSTSNYAIKYSPATLLLQINQNVIIGGQNATRFYSTSDSTRLRSTGVWGWSSDAQATSTVDTGIARPSAAQVEINNGTRVAAGGTYGDLKVRQHYVDQTITAAGTTGAQTINKAAGTVNFAAAATSLVVTNNLVTTSSTIFCTVRTNDSTAYIKNVVPAAGSFTITLGAAANAETSVGFMVIN